jgi:hypothetical protein
LSEQIVIEYTPSEPIEIILEGDEAGVITQEIEGEVQVIELLIEGPPGPEGPQGESGPPGDQYSHDQPAASDVWAINHNLGYWPIVRAFDRSGREIKGATVHLTIYTLEIHHKFLQAGYALLK